MRQEAKMHHHFDFEPLNWALIGLNIPVWVWLDTLWHHLPGPTAVYMAVSAAFMLFQMSDKLGLLERFKVRRKPAVRSED